MRAITVGRVGLSAAAAVSLSLLAPSTPAVGADQHSGLTLKAGAQYVSMGSSYSVGYLIKPQVPGTNPCGRSQIDYPHLVAKKLHLHLEDVGCGGAVTANAIGTPQVTHGVTEPPQLSYVTAKTKLVTITVGGNDVGYVATASRCGSVADCTTGFDQSQLDSEFAALPHSLKTLIHDIRAKAAPKVTIVFVTYPRLVPAKTCAALNYDASAKQLVGSIGARLEKVFRSVAKSTHILVADPYVLAAGHDACEPRPAAWVAGKTPSNGAAYHPTAAGHREMAHLIEQALAKA